MFVSHPTSAETHSSKSLLNGTTFLARLNEMRLNAPFTRRQWMSVSPGEFDELNKSNFDLKTFFRNFRPHVWRDENYGDPVNILCVR